MATVFGKEGNMFYTALYEPNAEKRRAVIIAWIELVSPVIQAAVSDELMTLAEFITQGKWTEKGWEKGETELHRIQNDYYLIMDIKLRKLDSHEKHKGELPEKVIYKPVQVVSNPTKQNSIQNIATDDKPSKENGADDDDYDDRNYNSNDDRSDSMNPNNDDYQASMDNHSDQMNPNNDTYWSSRGH